MTNQEFSVIFQESFSNEIVCICMGVDTEKTRMPFLNMYLMQYVLVFMLQGEVSLFGKTFQKGDVFLLYPNTPCSFSAKGDFSYAYIAFDCNVARKMFRKTQPVKKLQDVKMLTRLHQNLQELLRSVSACHTVEYNMRCVSLVYLVLSCVNRKDDSFSDMMADKTDYVRYFISTVERSYSSPELKVEDVCNKLGISVPYFTNFFTETMEISPRQYIIKYRMEKAKEILKYGNLNIQEVAQYVGYDNAFYFSNSFRKYTGNMPSAYKKNNRNSH